VTRDAADGAGPRRAEGARVAAGATRIDDRGEGRATSRVTRTEAETEALGAAIGRAAFPGAVLLLEGPLGAGKTVLVRGAARGLGVETPVTSPTFTILDVHEGRVPLFHVDLYRVESPAELRAVDLEEVFTAGGLTAVEWPRWLLSDPPAGSLVVRIQPAPEGRRVRLEPLDARWALAPGAA
jgi:tRNA threonylcarbamoyladenosine biosynthesis protein TsaE